MHHLGVLEATAMGIILIAGEIFLAFPRTIAQVGGTAAWMVSLVSAAVAPVACFLMHSLINRYPGKSLGRATEAALGPFFGTLVNLTYAAFFLFSTFVVLRQFAENIVAAILPKTPITIILTAFLLVMLFAAATGIEGIARVSWMVLPFMVVGLVGLLFGGLYTYTGLNAVLPFWGFGLDQVLLWGFLKSSLFSELLIFGVLCQHFRSTRQTQKVVWFTLLFSELFLLATLMVHLFVFPYPSATNVSFPLLEISRVIITGRWFQRVESLFFIMWILVAALKLSASFYASLHLLGETMRMTQLKHLVLPLALITYNLALLPESLPAAVRWDSDILRTWGWTVFLLLPGLTLAVSLLRRKGGSAGAN